MNVRRVLRSSTPTAALAVAAALLFSACGGGGGTNSEGPGAPRPSGAQADDPQLLQGRRIYVSYCARCHGSRGQGGIGPQLAGRVADRYPNLDDQKNIVRDGRGAMPGWAGTLSEDQIDAVVRYEREVL